ncbi:MAG TPA: universal stress protein [Candidatus Acidoferrales bacterium]|nr:universal stress protein [Candidatus Acidoferrales bacterium]
MFKTILVALDESEAAKEAFELAVNVATEDKAGLLLVNVIDVAKLVAVSGYETPYPADAIETMRESGEQLLKEMLAVCHAKGLKAGTAVGEGDAVDEILRFADENDAGLICIGTHGRTGLSRLFIGSVAEGVLRRANAPVLIVRPSKRAHTKGHGETAPAQTR